MSDILDDISEEVKEKQVCPKEAVIEKYVMEITRFPNGQTYVKAYPIGKVKYQGKKKAKKKDLPEAQVTTEEVH